MLYLLQKALYSIEQNMIEYSEELYMGILYAYYISAYNLSLDNTIQSPIDIIHNIYAICNTNKSKNCLVLFFI